MVSIKTKLIALILILGIFFTVGFVTPWHNLEPAVMPKLAVLTLIVGLSGVLLLLSSRNSTVTSGIFFYSIITAIFLSLFNLIGNGQFISERIFGVQGRNFGALTLICLLLLSMIAFQISKSIDPKILVITIKISSFVVAFYFLIQIQGFDRADWIDAYGGVPSSTLGNPNFVSAFVAIGFVSTLHLLTAKGTEWHFRIIIFTLSILEIYVAIESNSFQGLAIMILGCIYVILSSLKPFFLKITTRKGYLISGISLSICILAFVISRFRSFLSIDNSTLVARLDYWEAGIAMGLDSPFFGKGFDYFGESYLRFRSERAATRAPGLFTDSAHNYFIDILAFGGFPLLIAVLLPILLVIYTKFKIIFQIEKSSDKTQRLEKVSSGLFLSWLGFIFQALVSPLNIALAYLGFLLTGFLYGSFQRIKNGSQKSIPSRKGRTVWITSSAKPAAGIILLKVILLPLYLVIPTLGIQPMITDAKFRDGIEQGNGDAIYRIALSQPKNFQRMRYAAEIFIRNDREDLATPIIRQMVEQNPEKIAGWRMLEQVSKTEADKAEARAKILTLDPRNPDLNRG